MEHTALIIDDEPDIRELLDITLSKMNIACTCVGDIAAARNALLANSYDICLTDMKLPDGDGISLVTHVQENCPSMPIAVITAHGNMETAINSLKAGAFDFLTKPIDLALLRSLISSALRFSSEDVPGAINLVGESPQIIKLREKINKVARTQAPIFIHGESGTGKELVARMLHEQSTRRDKVFTAINCGAIPGELMESEFFGHVKGSFTGANADKQGLFAIADGGTLFLDEVAELPAHMQVKLLRVLQEKKVRPIGGKEETPVDVRIISASHRNLLEQLEKGEFRNDLYFRVNVIQLDLPGLRERGSDIPILAKHILMRLLKSSSLPEKLSEAAMSYLKAYSFPGNVRELENILERAVAFCDGEVIERHHIELTRPDGFTESTSAATSDVDLSDNFDLDVYLEDIERQVITEVGRELNWKKSAMAEKLGISCAHFDTN